MQLPHPSIVVPGITATNLHDQYELPPETVWSVLHKKYDRIIAHPNNLQYEARQPTRIVSEQLFGLAYEELIEELREDLPPQSDPGRQVPIYPWGYDWRQPLVRSVAALADFIDEVIERTKLMRHYHEDGYSARSKVNLIGHSMGGLVIAGYLAEHGAHRIGKVVTLATPFQGSLEAVVQLTTGEGDLGDGPQPRKRQASRLTPALYHLLPGFDEAFVPTGNIPDNFFDRGAWQPSVERTLQRFIDRHAITPAAVTPQDLFSSLLTTADEYLQAVRELDLPSLGMSHDDWLCVVGVDEKTRVQIEAAPDADGNVLFDLDSARKRNKWEKSDDHAEWVNTGDGTVPYLGAVPPFLPKEKLICVRPDDFGGREIKDRLLANARFGGFHGILPNMNMLHRLIAYFLRTDPGPLRRSIWGRPAPDLADRNAAGVWQPPIPGLRNKEID